MFKKTALCIALSALFVGVGAQAVTIYEKDNGDNLKLYGEVGVGGHFGPNYEYGEFYKKDNTYIDDSFGTIGVKGQYDNVYYRVEIDYERENWMGGSGDMVPTVDKMFVGYRLLNTKTAYHAIELGLTDTALDDYDAYGDFTFDTTVETGEAGDQASTIKYEGRISDFKMGISYSYDGESESGSKYGNVINGYIGYFSNYADLVLGAETRTGSEGESKYGEQKLLTLGSRIYVTDELAIGLNGFIEDEDIGQEKTITDITDPLNPIASFNDYQTQRNKGALISASYNLSKQWEFTGSYNYEEYEAWAIHNAQYGKTDYSWGDERTWATVGVNYRPTSSVIFAVEGNFGEAAQDVYAYARAYF